MILFIGNALAAGQPAKGDGWQSLLMIIAFIAVLYFLLMRPQQKRQKQHQELVASIKKGDKVVTNSGIIATVHKTLNDQEVVLEIADGVFCKFVKATIAQRITTDVPAAATSAKQVEDSGPVQAAPQQVAKTKHITGNKRRLVKHKKSSTGPVK